MKTFIKKLWTSKRGFGLIEVIVGLSMLALASGAALMIVHDTTKTERWNDKRVIGYNLGQMVMEEARRVRDSNWDDLNSDTRWVNISDVLKDYKKTVNKSDSVSGLGDCDSTMFGSETYCQTMTVDTVTTQVTTNTESVASETFKIEAGVQDVANIDNLHGVENKRAIDIDSSNAKRLTVKVSWDEQGLNRSLTLTTILTDWRPMI